MPSRPHDDASRVVRDAVAEHIAAFNAHDTARLLAGFATDAVWRTGVDVFRGTGELAELFDPWLWSLAPSLHVRSLVADAAGAAAELHETLTVEGEHRSYDIAAVFGVEDGLITRGTVYREGVADL